MDETMDETVFLVIADLKLCFQSNDWLQKHHITGGESINRDFEKTVNKLSAGMRGLALS